MAPRPAHVSTRFFGLRYLGATFRPLILLPRGRPTAFLPAVSQPPSPRAASSLCNWPALRERALPISSRNLINASIDIELSLDGRAICLFLRMSKRKKTTYIALLEEQLTQYTAKHATTPVAAVDNPCGSGPLCSNTW